jgi:hypothetical protein
VALWSSRIQLIGHENGDLAAKMGAMGGRARCWALFIGGGRLD